jgi:hypothetical protein
MKHNFLYNIILKDKIKIKNDNVFIFIVKYVFLTIFYLKKYQINIRWSNHAGSKLWKNIKPNNGPTHKHPRQVN